MYNAYLFNMERIPSHMDSVKRSEELQRLPLLLSYVKEMFKKRIDLALIDAVHLLFYQAVISF